MKDITIRRPVVWKTTARTDIGLVREINEDSVISLPEKQFWAVADGMGGYEAGNVASEMITSSLSKFSSNLTFAELADEIEDRLCVANKEILEYADNILEGRTLGSTVTTLAIKGRAGLCMWVGDSRLYRFRNHQLTQLSKDHSQVQEQIQQGYITAEQAANHPESNVITRAVGADIDLYVDINAFDAQLGDIFLLCSDGLYNLIPKDKIISIITRSTLDEAADLLLEEALAQGGDDNISLILVKGEQAPSRPVSSTDIDYDEMHHYRMDEPHA